MISVHVATQEESHSDGAVVEVYNSTITLLSTLMSQQ